jgi:hypothetical protein
MRQTKSLEQELRDSELLLTRQRDFTTKYKALIKKLHEIAPKVVIIESENHKQTCIDILNALADLRIRMIPELEGEIRELRDATKVKNKLKKSLRSEDETKRIYRNFEQNIKTKKQL